MQAETLLKRKVLKYLRTLPDIWVYKTCDKFTAGIPDILVCWNERFYAFELKTERGVVSKIQYHTLRKIEEAGGTTAVCRSVDDVKRFIG